MASLRDVAHHAGVSLATASRVASGSDVVRAETRERVERAMRELLYVPRGREDATGAIGLLVPELVEPDLPRAGPGDGAARLRRRARHDPLQHLRLRVPRGRLRAHAAGAPRRRDDLHLERGDRPPLGPRPLPPPARRGRADRLRQRRRRSSSTSPRSASTSGPRAGSRPSTCSSSAIAGSASRPARSTPARRARRPRATSPRCAPPGSEPTASSSTASSASRAAGRRSAPWPTPPAARRPGSSARAT